MTRQLSLTQDQLVAVNTTAPRVLLRAPAGSGKTEVLIRRIQRVMLDSAGESFRLLAVAYTVKAAEELRERLRETVADELWRVDCDTLHGFALDWLMRYGTAVGVTPDVVVYADDADRLALLADQLGSAGTEAVDAQRLRATLQAIDSLRTGIISSSSANATAEEVDVSIADAADAYSAALSRVGGIDFAAMLPKLEELLDADPWVLENFRRGYRHVLVDEGQDLTKPQCGVLQRLANDPVNLFVVADDRQSINGFAGGSFANAIELVGPNATEMSLQHNFRCAQTVLQAAERIADGLRGSQVVVVPFGAPPGQCIFAEAMNPEDEAREVRRWAEALRENGLDRSIIAEGEDATVSLEDIAVVARARWLLDPIVKEFREHGYPVCLDVEPSELLSAPEARLLLEGMATLTDPGDRPALRRFRDELGALGFETQSQDPADALMQTDVGALVELGRLLDLLKESPPQRTRFFESLLQQFGASPWAEDVRTITNLWSSYGISVSGPERSIKAFLRFVARARLGRAAEPGVRILTIHRVKGLEFRAVAIVGAYQGALPDYRARTRRDVDSERRSLYVAMTRARRILRVSWPRTTIDRSGRAHSQTPSSFITEAHLVQ